MARHTDPNNSRSPVAFAAILAIGLVVLLSARETRAFQRPSPPSMASSAAERTGRLPRATEPNRRPGTGRRRVVLFASPPPGKDGSDSVQKLFEYGGNELGDEIGEDDLAELEAGQPSEWMIMQQLLGISAFTYVLAALIVFFLGMNYALGPGWLGSQIGVPGTGDIMEVSPSLPGTIDLNRPEYRL
mmetsp:Transcript_5579/g.12822  ORF Transcript_5579/g.12822 Transcript_5579/m.12822 type:complete len:187 (+) Transcript_5579:101-661(+)